MSLVDSPLYVVTWHAHFVQYFWGTPRWPDLTVLSFTWLYRIIGQYVYASFEENSTVMYTIISIYSPSFWWIHFKVQCIDTTVYMWFWEKRNRNWINLSSREGHILNIHCVVHRNVYGNKRGIYSITYVYNIYMITCKFCIYCHPVN